MVDRDSGEIFVDPTEKQNVEMLAANQDRDKMNENSSCHAKNGFGV